ncbi:MAG: DeoR family transcriptional regulator [Patescibacteria group bacterium]
MPPATDERKKQLLRAVVREYIVSAEPVGSETVAEKYDFGVSSATIRNDMADLEDLGLLVQPHASAGRVPTARGYRFYVEEFAMDTELPTRERRIVRELVGRLRDDVDWAVREIAKTVAGMTAETVVVRLGDEEPFLTGISNLSNKPEFRQTSLLSEVFRAIDDLDRVVRDADSRLGGNVQVFIGEDNLFGGATSSVLAHIESPFGKGLIGIVGPQRMDYDANTALVRALREALASLE